MSDEPPPTFIFAPEIETSAVSIVWHEPERCALFLRELDPAVHLTQPHLRYVLEAINLAWGELGTADFASVTQVVRELGRFEDCGGLEGLNAVYSAFECVRVELTDPIFGHYLQMLKTYAIGRQDKERPAFWSGGSTALYRVKVRRTEQTPDFQGDAKIAGKFYSVRAWIPGDGAFINLKFFPQ